MGGTSPWWFAATLGFVGVLVGALAKWRLDLLLDRNKRTQDRAAELRSKKESLYLDLLTLFDRVALARINADESARSHQEQASSRHLAAAAEDLAAANKIMTSLSVFGVPEVRDLAEQCLRLLVANSRSEYERKELELSTAIRRDLGLRILTVEKLPEIPTAGWPVIRGTGSGITNMHNVYNATDLDGSGIVRRFRATDLPVNDSGDDNRDTP